MLPKQRYKDREGKIVELVDYALMAKQLIDAASDPDKRMGRNNVEAALRLWADDFYRMGRNKETIGPVVQPLTPVSN